MPVKYTYYLLFFLLLMMSCKKEKDEEYPSITITSPSAQSSYDVFESVNIKATITDNRNIEKITVRIVDNNGLSAAAPKTLTPGGTSYNLDINLLLNDIYTPTGQYLVKVTVSDGTNEKTVFLEIHINEVPKQLKKIIIVRTPAAGIIELDSLDGNNFTNFYTTASDYLASDISSYLQTIYLCGKFTGDMKAIDANNFYLNYSVPVGNNGSLPYFNNMHYSDISKLNFVSFGLGYLNGYNKNGTIAQNFNFTAPFIPGKMLETQQHIFCEQINTTGGNHKLSMHYKTSGTVEQSASTNIRWNNILEKDINTLVLAGNVALQGEIRIYNLSSNSFFEPVNIPSGTIYDMVQADANTYLIAHASGILKYTYSNSSLVNLTTGNKAQKLTWHAPGNLLFSAEGNILKTWDINSGFSLSNYTTSDSIKNILLHYNK